MSSTMSTMARPGRAGHDGGGGGELHSHGGGAGKDAEGGAEGHDVGCGELHPRGGGVGGDVGVGADGDGGLWVSWWGGGALVGWLVGYSNEKKELGGVGRTYRARQVGQPVIAHFLAPSSPATAAVSWFDEGRGRGLGHGSFDSADDGREELAQVS